MAVEWTLSSGCNYGKASRFNKVLNDLSSLNFSPMIDDDYCDSRANSNSFEIEVSFKLTNDTEGHSIYCAASDGDGLMTTTKEQLTNLKSM